METLPRLVAEGAGPFDLIFIDADKPNNPGYFEWSLKLSRPGTLIIVDNVVRGGAILDPDADDPTLGNDGIRGVRRFFELLAAEPASDATAIQTVGRQGLRRVRARDRRTSGVDKTKRRGPKPLERTLCRSRLAGLRLSGDPSSAASTDPQSGRSGDLA